MARKRMGAGSSAEINESNCWMLCGTCDQEMVCDGRKAVRIDNRVEVKGGRSAERFGRVNFEGVVIGRREEGEGIERVK